MSFEENYEKIANAKSFSLWSKLYFVSVNANLKDSKGRMRNKTNGYSCYYLNIDRNMNPFNGPFNYSSLQSVSFSLFPN